MERITNLPESTLLVNGRVGIPILLSHHTGLHQCHRRRSLGLVLDLGFNLTFAIY